MQFDEINIADILPQQPPFILVDRLLYCDWELTRTALLVRETNIFCDNGRLSAAGLIENIAQTCAARMGYINKYLQNDTVKVGFIGAIRKMNIGRLPLVGEQLVTQIQTIEEVFRMTLVSASIRCGEETLTACEMKISLTDK